MSLRDELNATPPTYLDGDHEVVRLKAQVAKLQSDMKDTMGFARCTEVQRDAAQVERDAANATLAEVRKKVEQADRQPHSRFEHVREALRILAAYDAEQTETKP